MYLAQRSYTEDRQRIYRRPSEIRSDIAEIKARIDETDNMINVRSLLLDTLCEFADGDPDKWLPEIEEIVAEARETLEHLSSLERTLSDLEDELKRTRWVMGYAAGA